VRDATEISDGAEEFALKNMMKYRGSRKIKLNLIRKYKRTFEYLHIWFNVLKMYGT